MRLAVTGRSPWRTIDRILGGMHRASHHGEIDDARAPFERVKRTEGPIQARAVSGIALQRQKVGHDLLDELPRLYHKLFEELVHRGTPQKIAMVRARSSRPTGLAEQKLAPAARAASILAAFDSVLVTRVGIEASGKACRLSALRKVTPPSGAY
jgi:hypothetical protein